MRVELTELIQILRAHFKAENIAVEYDVPLYIELRTEAAVRRSVDNATFDTPEGGMILVDLDSAGTAIGIEFL